MSGASWCTLNHSRKGPERWRAESKKEADIVGKLNLNTHFHTVDHILPTKTFIHASHERSDCCSHLLEFWRQCLHHNEVKRGRESQCENVAVKALGAVWTDGQHYWSSLVLFITSLNDTHTKNNSHFSWLGQLGSFLDLFSGSRNKLWQENAWREEVVRIY